MSNRMQRCNLHEQLISVVKIFTTWENRFRLEYNIKLDVREVRFEDEGKVFSWFRIESSGEIL
jgi:hypothetical protein